MHYRLSRVKGGQTEYLEQIYTKDGEFKVRVTTDINKNEPISKVFLGDVLKLLPHTGEKFEVERV